MLVHGYHRKRAMRSLRALLAVVVVAGTASALHVRGRAPSTSPVPANCAIAGPTRSAFPATGTWGVVNQQDFNVTSLPSSWYAFQGYYQGGSDSHDSLREPSMLAFPGSWMEFKNQVYSNGANGSDHTIADAGAGELYPETYDPATKSDEQGYDVASATWGFQWCTRFNGGPGFDTAFAFVPANGAWPPEIDFIEHGPRDGNTVTIHIHWKATTYNDGDHCDQDYPARNSQDCHATFPRIKLVVGRWNRYAVTWSAGRIGVWINGVQIRSLTITPRICTQRADRLGGFKDTGTETLCLPNGYANSDPSSALEPFLWDMQVNSYNGVTTYPGDQTDLAWFQALRLWKTTPPRERASVRRPR
jgi:hypothetical protein